MKPFLKSRTVLAGLGITLLSLFGIVVDVWAVLDEAQRDWLIGLYGPEAGVAVGILMVALRVITTTPLFPPEEEPKE